VASIVIMTITLLTGYSIRAFVPKSSLNWKLLR